MGLADWDDSYSVGYKKLDDQHKNLFRLINELNDLSLQKQSEVTFKDLMEEILEYTAYHFFAEEEIMRKHGFPHVEKHKLEHDEMRRVMRDFYARCIDEDFICLNEVLEELIDWLHTHLGKADTLYAQYFKEKGVFNN
ncbi:MAG: bacteriohemerythrin [Nitrospinota bacterium]|nr:bacteriohemerythrin [Nitrospinota bacterium]